MFMNLSGCSQCFEISEACMKELLVAITTSSPINLEISLKILSFTSNFSTTASITNDFPTITSSSE